MAKRKAKSRSTTATSVKETKSSKHPFWPYGLVMFALLLTADQYAKRTVITLLPQGGSMRVLPWLDFTYVQNTGSLWGSLNGGGLNGAFIWLSVAAFGALLYFHDRFTTAMERLALWMLVAGLWGNLIDRVTLGFVVDFIDLRWWPVFNIADACIVAGVALYLLETIRLERERKKTAA